MLKRLNEQLETQRQLGTMHAFRLMRPECGIVFSDGTKPTQRRAAVANEPCCSWWPVLFVRSPYEENAIIGWCQAQAQSGSRAWETDPTRVVGLRNATQQATEPVIIEINTPGVTIEELEDSDDETEQDALTEPVITDFGEMD